MTQSGYPPEARAIPQVAVAEVHKAVTQAVKAGDLWLVFGNDSVWQDEPTPLQLDATAKVFRRPPVLNAIRAFAGRAQGCLEHGSRTEDHRGEALRRIEKSQGQSVAAESLHQHAE